MKILMVCLGNICRSPLAEGILQHKAKEAGLSWQVESAGTESYHIGEPPDPRTVDAALSADVRDYIMDNYHFNNEVVGDGEIGVNLAGYKLQLLRR